ncbi:MAG: GT4 family glycosyltransferase PelF [Clostridia bacterium]
MRICVICEGCYPFVMGGVSSWLQGLMEAMPQHEFVIWAIGAEEKKRGHFAYTPPANVVAMRDVYLDSVLNETMDGRAHMRGHMTKPQADAVQTLFRCGDPDWAEIFHYFNKRKMDNVSFLLQQEFLTMLEEICTLDYPYVGFADYFWTIRSMFLPLLYLMGDSPPDADLYYAVSAGYAGVLGAMASQLKHKPFILTEHGIYTREREEEILRTDWVPPHFKDLWIHMFYMFTRCAYHYATRVTSLFHRASAIQQEIGCPAEKCVVIPNGVQYEQFASIPRKEPDGWMDVGAVVRVVPIKDIKTMLYAFSLVCAEEAHVRLHIMGTLDEDAEYYEECLQLKEELQLDRVIFTGRVNVREYMRKLDFTLLTSLSEGQPLAVLESMAASRPAVTTNVGCCNELLDGVDDDYGAAGICAPVMHQSALAMAILTLCASPPLVFRMGEAGRKRVDALYRHKDMLDRYEQLFREVTAQGGAC